jgi:hypothetical protein
MVFELTPWGASMNLNKTAGALANSSDSWFIKELSDCSEF